MLLYLQYYVYDTLVAASFLHSSPSKSTTQPRNLGNQTYELNQCMTIVATSEVGKGATGVAISGTLNVPANMDGARLPVPLDVVVKLAFDAGQRDSLKNEYEIYLRLQSRKVHRGI